MLHRHYESELRYFREGGAAFAEATGLERRGPVGDGEGVLLPLVPLVDFGAAWMARHRRAEAEHGPEP